MNKLIAVLVVSCVGVFASAGCAVDSGEERSPAATQAEKPTPAEEENIGKTESALSGGVGVGGGGLNFNCGALGCICNGDVDCNNLFSGGACGSWPSKCYIRGPSTYCICAPWVGASAAPGAGKVTGVATAGVSTK